MLNKFFSLPTDSPHPVYSPISLDDDDDGGEIQEQTHGDVKSVNIAPCYLRYPELKKKLWNNKINESELKELSTYLSMTLLKSNSFLSENIENDVCSYILSLFANNDENNLTAGMFVLAHQIPIYTITDNKEKMSDDEYSPEHFGFYCVDSFPTIYLHKERIETGEKLLWQSKKVRLDRNVLYAIVIIYALSNAILDSANELDLEGQLTHNKEKGEQRAYTEAEAFGNKVLATVTTLRFFGKHNQYQQIKEYFSVLPMPYKVGVAEYERLRETKKRIANVQCN